MTHVDTISGPIARGLTAFYAQNERDRAENSSEPELDGYLEPERDVHALHASAEANALPTEHMPEALHDGTRDEHAGQQPVHVPAAIHGPETAPKLTRADFGPVLPNNKDGSTLSQLHKGLRNIMPDSDGFFHLPSTTSSDEDPVTVQPAQFGVASAGSPDTASCSCVHPASHDVLALLLGWSRVSDSEHHQTRQSALITRPLASQHECREPAINVERPVTPEPTLPSNVIATTTPSKQPTQESSAKSSPFGEGVRGLKELSRTLSQTRRPPYVPNVATHSAQPDSTENHADGPRIKRRRYEHASIYDLFQAREMQALSPESAPLRHTRTVSMTSLDSYTSDSTRATAHQITVCSAPGDDPRFIIWGEKRIPIFDRRGSGSDHQHSPPGSRRWSLNKDRKSTMSSASEGSLPVTSIGTQRVIMAATVERWVAELTSKIDDELISAFFLTFRQYMAGVDVLRALISRFEWAVMPAERPEEKAARRIARVRTILVIRHWLLNYFPEDFVGDRDLRSLLCDWLNSLSKAPHIRQSPKDHQLVKSLKKIVRRTKEKFAQELSMSPLSDASEFSISRSSLFNESDAARSSVRLSTVPETTVEKPPVGDTSLKPAIVLDSDVDLDIDVTLAGVADANVKREPTAGTHLSPASPPRTRRRTSEPTLLSAANTPKRTQRKSFSGQLARFRRLLGSRQAGMIPSDGLTTESEDMLYPTSDSSQPSTFPRAALRPRASLGVSDSTSSRSPTSSSGVDTPATESDFVQTPRVHIADDSQDGLGIVLIGVNGHDPAEPLELHHSTSSQTIKSASDVTPAETPHARIRGLPQTPSSNSSSGSAGSPPATGRIRPLFASTFITQNADLELSDSDDDGDKDDHGPTLRRLPGGRNLKEGNNLRALFTRKSSDSMSSAGTGQSRLFWRRSASPAPPDADESGVNGVMIVNNFVVEGLDSDDEEPGDVEAALARLEGQISETRLVDNARRVEVQLKKSAAVAAKRKGMSHIHASANAGSIEGDISRTASTAPSYASSGSGEAPSSSNLSRAGDGSDRNADESPLAQPLPTISLTAPAAETTDSSPTPASETLLAVPKDPVVSRKPSIRRLFGASVKISAFTKHLRPPAPSAPAYHSFLLHCKTETVAQHFSVIERNLLLRIEWTELLRGSWRHAQLAEMLSWEQYLKERRRRSADGSARDAACAIQDLNFRFNLVANFIASEVLQTMHLDERVALVNKIIRLAWKAYRHSNFQTLSQIIGGLQLPHVERLRKTWSRIGVWERRVYDDLKQFTTPLGNFAALRRVISSFLDDHGPLGAVHGASSPNAQRPLRTTKGSHKAKGQSTGCLPFVGIFLRDLALVSDLPTFLDPTSPSISVDNADEVEAPAFPDAFSHLPALPTDTPLRPLVNVHKQRTLSGIIEKVLISQEMAASCAYEPDPILFRKCSALSCLSVEMMRTCSLRCEPA